MFSLSLHISELPTQSFSYAGQVPNNSLPLYFQKVLVGALSQD
jgi:hypothetical protein